MIPPVSINQNNPNFRSRIDNAKIKVKEIPAVNYADLFIKHSIDSLPVLTTMDIIWSCIDKSNGIPFKKAFVNNTKKIVLPIMLISSAIMTIIESVNIKNIKTG